MAEGLVTFAMTGPGLPTPACPSHQPETLSCETTGVFGAGVEEAEAEADAISAATTTETTTMFKLVRLLLDARADMMMTMR